MSRKNKTAEPARNYPRPGSWVDGSYEAASKLPGSAASPRCKAANPKGQRKDLRSLEAHQDRLLQLARQLVVDYFHGLTLTRASKLQSPDSMKTNPMKWLLGCTLAGAISMTQLSAGAAETREVKLERSHVEKVNVTNMTFTVTMKETNLTVRYTSETRFFLRGKPSASKDLEAGDHVRGTLRQPENGPAEALRIQIEKLAPK